MSRKTDSLDLPEDGMPIEQPQPEAPADPEEYRLVKDGEELTVHRSALNHYLSAGWKRG